MPSPVITPQTWISHLKQHRAIAIIRATDGAIAQVMAETAIHAGFHLIEVTWTCGNAANLIQQLRHTYPHCIVGTGTIRLAAELQGAIAAGAQFAFSPHTDPALIHAAHQHQVPMIPGALTPTEIMTAWQQGATTIKVFPIKVMGGVDYLACLQQPLGAVPLIPTGGVTLDNAVDFLKAGAIAVGISSHLFPQELVQRGDWDGMKHRAIAFIQDLQRL